MSNALGLLLAGLLATATLSGCSETDTRVARAAPRKEPRPTSVPSVTATPLATGPTETVVAASAPLAARETSPEPAPPSPATSVRVFAKTRFVWIRERPDWGSPWVGYLWSGTSAPLKTGKPVYARGCEAWYEVSPRGFVCVDERRATLDPSDAGFRELAAHPADYDSATPHHYAGSLGVERYLHLPALPEQHAREPDLTPHLQAIATARSGAVAGGTLIGVDLSPAPMDAVDFAALPAEVQIQRHTLRRDSTLAYLGEYRHGERTFLLTADYAWIPKDRVRPFSPIAFHGVELTGDVALPIAFFRIHDRPSFRKLPDGDFVPVADVFHRLEWVPLTGRQETVSSVTYVETTRAHLWVREDDAVIPHPPEHTPWGSPMSATRAPVAKRHGDPRRTWIEVDVFGGWLLAYEGTTPIFTTLVSTGRGGVAVPAEDAAKTSSTPLGQFVVTGKFVTATMDGPTEVSHTDVPWVQNFSGPHSIHTAYWHDAWGERVSSGCVNVSPLDGKYLFEFSEPKVPPGWHAAVWDMHREASTLVVVHR